MVAETKRAPYNANDRPRIVNNPELLSQLEDTADDNNAVISWMVKMDLCDLYNTNICVSGVNALHGYKWYKFVQLVTFKSTFMMKLTK